MEDLALLVVPDLHDLTKVPGLRNLHVHHFHALQVVAAAAAVAAAIMDAVAEAVAAPKAVAAVEAVAAAEDPAAKTTGKTADALKVPHAAVNPRLRRNFAPNG